MRATDLWHGPPGSPVLLGTLAALVALGVAPAAGCASAGNDTDGDPSAGAWGGSGSGGEAGAGAHAGAAGGAGGLGGGSVGGGGAGGAGAGGVGAGGAGAGGAGAGGSSGGGQGGAGAGGAGGTGGTGGTGGGGGNAPDACGFAGDGVWFEIDYSSAQSATNPDWLFSATPGFGEPEWAPNGSNWPEVWDVYNNIAVTNDPIGRLAELGPSSTLQVMLGLTTLQSYSHATVCVEGRSVSTNASVIFDVYNPLNGCGASATMAHDWVVHAVGVDIGDCMLEGVDFHALRIEPSGGSSALGIVRLRLTLHDAVY